MALPPEVTPRQTSPRGLAARRARSKHCCSACCTDIGPQAAAISRARGARRRIIPSPGARRWRRNRPAWRGASPVLRMFSLVCVPASTPMSRASARCFLDRGGLQDAFGGGGGGRRRHLAPDHALHHLGGGAAHGIVDRGCGSQAARIRGKGRQISLRSNSWSSLQDAAACRAERRGRRLRGGRGFRGGRRRSLRRRGAVGKGLGRLPPVGRGGQALRNPGNIGNARVLPRRPAFLWMQAFSAAAPSPWRRRRGYLIVPVVEDIGTRSIDFKHALRAVLIGQTGPPHRPMRPRIRKGATQQALITTLERIRTSSPPGTIFFSADPPSASVVSGSFCDRAIVQPHLRAIDPGQRMLAPVGVIALGMVLMRVCAAAFGAGMRAIDRGQRVGHQVGQFQASPSGRCSRPTNGR